MRLKYKLKYRVAPGVVHGSKAANVTFLLKSATATMLWSFAPVRMTAKREKR